KTLAPVLAPAFRAVGVDPSVLAGLLLANESGGWPLALALADDPEIEHFTFLGAYTEA
ncbi:MAG: ethanolamine utilization protein EutH, partial [Kiritimatiellae bacterium]|nr:ethanolamine utilization protein EutH [Kiritimatiellia bacterium]